MTFTVECIHVWLYVRIWHNDEIADIAGAWAWDPDHGWDYLTIYGPKGAGLSWQDDV